MKMDWRNLFARKATDAEPTAKVSDESPVSARVYAIGDSIGGEYRVEDIFTGGMGRVYLVSHNQEDEPLVMKTLQRPENEFERAQFLREAEVWLGLGRHRNIVAARFVRMLEGQVYVAADFVPEREDRGNTLGAYVGHVGLPEGLLLTWITQFCHGMEHAQSRGVVAHRDIKPGNLMLMPDNELRITDFGLARSFTLPSGAIEGLAERRSISGTLPYMSPEQFLAPERVDHRADIYAFGVTLYELISGTRPFVGTDERSLIAQILRSPPRPLQSRIWAICDRCLRKSPDHRYQTYEELLGDVGKMARDIGITIPSRPKPIDLDIELIYSRVISYYDMGRPDLALQHALQFSQLMPDDARGWTEIGRLYLAQGKLEQSVEASRHALSLSPFSPTARNNLGVALNRLNRPEQALQNLQIAASHDPLNTGALLNQSNPLIALRRPLEAIQVLRRAAKIAPEKASIWTNLGAAFLEVGQDDEAEQCFRRALELHPGQHEAQENLRTLHARRKTSATRQGQPNAAKLIAAGRYREAEASLLAKVSQDPNDVDAWHNLGIIAVNDGRRSEAIDRFQRVIALSPTEDFARKQLIHLLTDTGDIEGALRQCSELAQQPKHRVTALLIRAQLLQGIGKSAQAVSELRELAQANPELDQVWFILSEILERSGRRPESLKAAMTALAILRKHGGHADNIAMVESRIARLNSSRA